MFKVIAKTALKTLAVVAAVIAVAFGVASIGFPSAMAGVFEKLGNYSFATGYASLSYTYSKDIADLSRCAQDSILSKNDKNTVKFGDKLIAHEGFYEFCSTESERLKLDYSQYICGGIACAKYRTGDTRGAISLAADAVEKSGGFSEGNAIVQLTLAVEKKGDKAAAEGLLNVITTISAEGKNYEAVINTLNKIINQGDRL